MHGFSVHTCRSFLAAEEEFVMNVSINHIEIFGILSLVRSFLSETNDYDDLFSFRALTGIALL